MVRLPTSDRGVWSASPACALRHCGHWYWDSPHDARGGVTILARCVGLEFPWNFEGSQEAILYAVFHQGEEYLLRLMKIGKFILIQ